MNSSGGRKVVRLIKTLSLLSILILAITVLNSCGGGGGGGSSEGSSVTISGTAATGQPITYGTVTLKDTNGLVHDTVTDSNGNYSFDININTPPFMLQVVPNIPGSVPLYSFTENTGITNITPLTNLTLYESSSRSNLGIIFDSGDFSLLSPDSINNSEQMVRENFSDQFLENDLDPEAVNLLHTQFVADETGMDAVLHDVNIMTFSTGTNDVVVTNSKGECLPYGYNITGLTIAIDGMDEKYKSSFWGIDIQSEISDTENGYLKKALDNVCISGQVSSLNWTRNPSSTTTQDAVIALKIQLRYYVDQGYKPINIIAHSWGSIIAYIALHELSISDYGEDQTILIENFITLGSPIHCLTGECNFTYDTALRNTIPSSFMDKETNKPENVKYWINFHNQFDIISREINDDDCNILNLPVDNCSLLTNSDPEFDISGSTPTTNSCDQHSVYYDTGSFFSIAPTLLQIKNYINFSWGDSNFWTCDQFPTQSDPPGAFSLNVSPPYCDTREPAGPAVELSWSTASNTEYYRVFRDDTAIGVQLNSNQLNFLNNMDLLAGYTYDYKVMASNAGGDLWSNTQNIYIPDNICSTTPDTESDLVIQNLTVDPTNDLPESNVIVRFTIHNQGDGNAGANITNIRINESPNKVTTNDPLLLSISIPSIDAGESYNVSKSVTIPSLTTGSYYIWVIGDIYSTAGQSNEANDKAKTIFTVNATIPPEPDESVSKPNIPSGPASGNTGISYTYSTGGATSSQEHTLEYRFDWGDGSTSSWSTSITATHSWGTPGTYNVRIIARCSIDTSIQNSSSTYSVTIAAPPAVKPTATTATAQVNSSTSAQLLGTINPNGDSASGWFQYGTTASYGNNTPSESLGNGTTVSQLLYTLSDLSPSTTYHFRVVAQNSAGTSYGEDMVFTTQAPPVVKPTATTNSAASVSETMASLNGTVNPNGSSCTSWFQYGTTTSYGSTSPTFPYNGTGTSPINLNWTASGLSPGTAYHFRAVSQNSAGTSYGVDKTFTTETPEPDETITKPNIPSGPTSGITGASYTYSIGGAISNQGHAVEYWFDWGDGSNSGWISSPTPSASHTWSSASTWLVKAKARCSTHPSIESAWSTGIIVTISSTEPDETVSKPNTPSGPASGNTGISYTYSTGGATSSKGHAIEYWFAWGDGTNSGWISSPSASHTWSLESTWFVTVKARCGTHPSIESSWSTGIIVTISSPEPGETISTPGTPIGSTNITTGSTYLYSTTGATSNLGHTIEYRFDWNDGTYSNWSTSAISTPSHSWVNGTYNIKVQARCQTHTSKTSTSSAKTINVTSSDTSKPTVNVTSPCSSSCPTASSTITVGGTATDSGGSGLDKVFVNNLTNASTGFDYSVSGNSSSFSVSGITLNPGQNEILVQSSDVAGNSSTIFTIYVTYNSPQVERITNGSFSSGISGWTPQGSDYWAGTTLSNYRTSPGYAALGVDSSGLAKDYADGAFYQTISIPSNATSATLSFWYYITTNETGSTPYDYLYVTVRNSSGGWLADVAELSNVNSTSGYVQKTYNMTPYKGQTIRIRFGAVSDESNTTTFRIDDVSLMANGS